MPAFFATEYTIHFDDTMAYGSHHFLTSFKFQCAARETFMFGEHVYDVTGVKDALDSVHLLTSDAYARNQKSTLLGNRVAILLTLEEWGQASARFCYRVIDQHGDPVCAGFQTLVCASAETNLPMPLPLPLREALNAVREIEEAPWEDSFRDRVLAGGSQFATLFPQSVCKAAVQFLANRYPRPSIIPDAEETGSPLRDNQPSRESSEEGQPPKSEVWCFAGQGAFDSELLLRRIDHYRRTGEEATEELEQCGKIASDLLSCDAHPIIDGSVVEYREAIEETPELLQVAIHLQNVLGGILWQSDGHHPSALMGHSFGEIAAFTLAGCFDLPTSVHIVCLRALAVNRHAPADGGLLVASGNRHSVQQEAALNGLDQVLIAGRNHEKQTVLTGPNQQLERMKSVLSKVGIHSIPITSPTSFHHPRLNPAAAWWLEQLQELKYESPKTPLYTCIGRRFINESDNVHEILTSQLLRPFDLQGGVADIIGAGATTLVDCGSSGSLARLISGASIEPIEVLCAANQRPEEDVSQQNSNDSPRSTITTESISPPETNSRSIPTVSIVGQGCILPGGATSPAKLFESIIEQRTGIVDQRRFDPDWSHDFYSESLEPDRSTSHLTGRVDDHDIICPANVDPKVFEGFSRLQRLLCIAIAPLVETLEGADRVMCLVGSTADGFEDQDEAWALTYAGIDPTAPEIDSMLGTANSAKQTPHQAVQEVFDKVVRSGLEVTLVDAACASSLYSVALGMNALENDLADAVIAGGCFCPGPGNSCLFSQFHGTTSTGCRPFDADADGVVFSEAAAFVTLRRTKDAKENGLPVHAVIRGTGLSSDGRSPSANVPQSRGQILSLERCYKNYAIDPSSIQAIEGHGTSTNVGDSTELETLRQFFSNRNDQPIPIHSLKGKLGHAGWAAGTASMIAASEYLRHRTFPSQAGFQEPSEAMKRSQATLRVADQPVSLSSEKLRIAIDGFGFGGANAHLVVENDTTDAPLQTPSRKERQEHDELVFVAFTHLATSPRDEGSHWFDRTTTKLPEECLVLPELADDLDISQILSVRLAKQIIDQLPGFDDHLRQNTSMILAFSGKTERGIEATARIMTTRFKRILEGHDDYTQMIDASHDRARASGPYTLQCMMPNVATGRAALLLNLNGPNFVVDAGKRSLDQAISAATLLLNGGDDSGTKLAIIGAINANTIHDSNQTNSNEFAAAFGITSRRIAEKYGWNILANTTEALQQSQDVEIESANAREPSDSRPDDRSFAHRLGTVIQNVTGDRIPTLVPTRQQLVDLESNHRSSCRIFAPIWVEKKASHGRNQHLNSKLSSLHLISPAVSEHVEALQSLLPAYTSNFSVSVVGRGADRIVSDIDDPRVRAVDLENESSIRSELDAIRRFSAQAIVVTESIITWDVAKSLANVADDNSLCEFLFLVAQDNVDRLRQGEMELWGLFLDAWNGSIHAKSGAVAGLLKSIRREMPSVTCGTICTTGLSLSDAMLRLNIERSQTYVEPELVYERGVRHVRRLRQTKSPVHPVPQVRLDENSVVVASGGARGVTAVMLEQLVRQYGCHVVALGRSALETGLGDPNDPIVEQNYYRQYLVDHPDATAAKMRKSFESACARWEAASNIARLKKLGNSVHYVEVDVTDLGQVARAVEIIAARYGKVDLLVHGAGVQASKKLQDRSLLEFRRTYAVKVIGLNNLSQALKDQFGQLVPTHVLTSAYSIFGNDGQHDYCAANETMDRLCDMTVKNDQSKWTSIAWLAWDGIGMTRGSEYKVLAAQRKLSGVDAATGQEIFQQVIDGRTDSAINVPISEAEHVQYSVETIPTSTLPSKTSPGTVAEPNNRILEVQLDLSQMECLEFHKVRGIPTLPGAWIVDRLVGAALQLCPQREEITQVELNQVNFLRFVRCTNDRDQNLRVVIESTDDGYKAWLMTDVIHTSGQVLSKDIVCATANINFHRHLSPSIPQVCRVDRASHQLVLTVNDPYCRSSDQEVDLSGPFDCLGKIEIGSDGRRAHVQPSAIATWPSETPALLLDAAWRVAAVHATKSDSLFVPVEIQRLVLPIGVDPAVSDQGQWEVRSSTPQQDGRDVRWERTEVIDPNGDVRILVRNGFAKCTD